MFRLQNPDSLFARAGLALLISALFLFILGLPPFQVGFWGQTEPVVLGLFAVSLFTCLWLAYGIAGKKLNPIAATPLWMALLAWTLWQIVPTLLAASPWRSWFGPPQTGEGFGWYVALLLMIMLAVPLWAVVRYRSLLLQTGTGIIALLCLLHWSYPVNATATFDPHAFTPVQYPAYLAFLAAYVWLAAATLPAPAPKKIAALLLMAAITIYSSHNKSAMALLPLPLLVSAGAAAFPTRFRDRKIWRILAVAACLAPLGWVLFSQTLSGDGTSMLYEKDGSIGSRAVLNRVVAQTLAHEPSRWAIGGGWGRFDDDIFKTILMPDMHTYENGEPHANCSLIDGGAFHSHSQPMEALLSLGLPGLILWFAIPIAAIFALPANLFWRAAPPIVGITALGFFWFQLIECLPFEALAFAALLNADARPAEKQRSWPVPVLLLGALVMAWSCLQQAHILLYDARLQDTFAGRSLPDASDAWLTEDAARGGDRFRTVAPYFAKQVAAHEQRTDATTYDAAQYRLYLQTADAIAKRPNIGADFLFSRLWLDLFTLTELSADPLFSASAAQAKQSLDDGTLAAVRAAPLRDDRTAYYIQHLADTGHDEAAQIAVLKNILAVAPKNRPALWALGHLLMKQPEHKEEGLAMVKESVSLGVQRIAPITDAETAPFK